MSTAPPNPSDSLVLSPALSATSYDMVSGRSRSPSVVSQRHSSHDNYSDDEIVWSVAESSSTDSDSTGAAPASEDGEYVLLNPPSSALGSAAAQRKTRKRGRKNASRAHTPTVETGSLASLEARMQSLNLAEESNAEVETRENGNGDAATQRAAEKRRKRKAKKQKNKASVKTPVLSPNPPLQPEEEGFMDKASAVLPSTGLGDRGIVDDFSDTHSVVSFNGETVVASPTLYEEATTYISSFLSNPEAKNNAVCRLTLLQSLIIELGLSTPSLPDTLQSAKAFLKAHAFLNIREYLSARQEGPEAVQRAMYPSRSALIKDIKRKRSYTSLKWVKRHGLQVLLVGVMYR